MYITIITQKLGATYSQSSADFVGYLEKENQGLEQQDMEKIHPLIHIILKRLLKNIAITHII